MIQSKYFVRHSGIPTFAPKRKKTICLIMYSIMVQVARSRHQLIENLTWKDGHTKRLFTKCRKLRS